MSEQHKTHHVEVYVRDGVPTAMRVGGTWVKRVVYNDAMMGLHVKFDNLPYRLKDITCRVLD